METKTSIRLYNNKPVRAYFDDENSIWLYAAVDLINAIIDTNNPRRYWSDLKRRNGELFANCVQVKLTARDGKKYMTDVLNAEELNALIGKLSKKNNGSIQKR